MVPSSQSVSNGERLKTTQNTPQQCCGVFVYIRQKAPDSNNDKSQEMLKFARIDILYLILQKKCKNKENILTTLIYYATM